MRQVSNELLTAEEAAAIGEDIDLMVTDSPYSTTINYTVKGTQTFNRETGTTTSSDTTYSAVSVLRLTPTAAKLDDLKITAATDIVMVRVSDLPLVEPKISDTVYLVDSGKTVYPVAWRKPEPGYHWYIALNSKAKNG